MKKILWSFILILCMSCAFYGCSSCDRTPVEPEQVTSLNFDSIVRADYEAICSDVNDTNTMFYEAQVWFDTNLNDTTVAQFNIVRIMTVFQCMDTCTMITHTLTDGVVVDSISKVADYWMEDMKTTPYNNVSLDSAIVCAKTNAHLPESKFVVMRRPLYPPFPEENYFIFGNMVDNVCVDAKDGHIVSSY